MGANLTSGARVAVMTAGAMLFAGCTPAGSSGPVASSSPATASASATVAGPVLSGTVSISGAASIPATSFTVRALMEAGQDQVSPPPRATCTDYANGFDADPPSAGRTGFVVPMLQTNGYHNIYVGVTMISGYRGPGTYENRGFPSLTGVAVEGIGTAGAAVYTVFNSHDHGAMTLTVHADGSGSLIIAHWGSDEVRQTVGASQVAIDGVVTWTCSG